MKTQQAVGAPASTGKKNIAGDDWVSDGAAYGAGLGGRVVVEIWQKLGLVAADKVRPAADLLVGAVDGFLSAFPDANDEALVIELKGQFDGLIGEVNPPAFSRLMAARLLRLMVEGFRDALDKKAQGAAPRRAMDVPVLAADEVGFLPDDESGLSAMGERGLASL